ncbi:unnamed protein product [Chrysoparadoxa australica]
MLGSPGLIFLFPPPSTLFSRWEALRSKSGVTQQLAWDVEFIVTRLQRTRPEGLQMSKLANLQQLGQQCENTLRRLAALDPGDMTDEELESLERTVRKLLAASKALTSAAHRRHKHSRSMGNIEAAMPSRDSKRLKVRSASATGSGWLTTAAATDNDDGDDGNDGNDGDENKDKGQYQGRSTGEERKRGHHTKTFSFSQVDDMEAGRLQEILADKGVEVPTEFICPLTNRMMVDPVYLCGDGNIYDLSVASAGMKQGLSPKTGKPLGSINFIAPKHDLRKKIHDFLRQHGLGSFVLASKN